MFAATIEKETSVVPKSADSPRGDLGTRAVSMRRPGRREQLVFVAAAVVIVLHTLANAYLFVEPGVARSEHLLAGLVPTAIVVAAAAFYARMPAGLRASLGLVFGALALVAGGVSVSAARRGVLAADDWTGLLLVVAGAALVALAGWVLWASRKTGGRPWWRVVRRVLLAVAAVFVLYWVVLPISFAIFATERPRDPVGAVDLGRPHRDVTLTTSDGLRLSAWYAAPRNGAVVITFPRDWTASQARMLVRNGFGVLMVDPRGYGSSEGDPNAYGWGSTRDIDAAVAWLQAQPGVEDGSIGGLGLSMGGEQMIEAAAGNDGLKAVVSEGAGVRSVREALLRRGPNALELALQYPQDLVQTAAVWVLSGEAPPSSLADAAPRIAPRAVFFIYGEDGQAIEPAVNPAYYDAAGEPKEIWQVPGAGHTGGIRAQPAEYERRVVDFFVQELLEGR